MSLLVFTSSSLPWKSGCLMPTSCISLRGASRRGSPRGLEQLYNEASVASDVVYDIRSMRAVRRMAAGCVSEHVALYSTLRPLWRSVRCEHVSVRVMSRCMECGYRGILRRLGNGFVLAKTTICFSCEMYPFINPYR